MFSGHKYGLDYYQREYSWSKIHVRELLDDLSNSFDKDFDNSHERSQVANYQPYFLGPIVTSEVEGIQYLVDGQQRLTTLILLLIHLNHIGKKIKNFENLQPLIYSHSFGRKTFTIDVPDRENVMQAILDGNEFDSLNQSESVENIWNRFQNIIDFFPDWLKDDNLPFFCDWLLARVFLVQIETTDTNMALEVFETMNDRGLRLSNIDMLKAFMLAGMKEERKIEESNKLWREQITALTDIEKEKSADSDFFKHWLRGKYAKKIRQRKKDATPEDFDIIGTAFHKWVRDNKNALCLNHADDFYRLINHDFKRMSDRYIHLLKKSYYFDPDWEYVYYNATNGFTLQYLPIMASVTPDDDDDTFQEKSRMISGFLDLFLARRMVNFRNIGYSSIVYTIFNLAIDIRNTNQDTLRDILADRIASFDDSFEGVERFYLTQRNKSHIRYLLARMTSWIESECDVGNRFPEYVDRKRKDPFEIEHILADRYDRHTKEFDNPHDFADHRNQFGGLLLLPKSFNASYGNKEYQEKQTHYFAHNLLAASLHPDRYKYNPSFKRFLEETALSFKYHNKFNRQDLQERQSLYGQICRKIWDPERLGLGGGIPSNRESKQNRKKF